VTRFRDQLFADNRRWAEARRRQDPQFFAHLARQQRPEILWIGCSDSRVPANEIIGRLPGELFVHRNVANLVLHTDFNCQSVVQYAVEMLRVRHVVVCGHYGCGGVAAALESRDHGLIHNWLRHIKDVHGRFREELDALESHAARVDRLCELNVQAQVGNLARSSTVQNAWGRGQGLEIHGWIYSIADGLLRDLGIDLCHLEQVPEIYRTQG
jgi:carbonic anhydrase